MDPACGSGNFLTETYLSLRKLENKCIKLRLGIEGGALDVFGDEFAIQVNISRFYGIEINDFAVVVAKTALWIAESQMMKETANILQRNLDFLPLKSYTNIIEDNALRIDWETVVPKQELNYIMGNPPFVGARLMAQGSVQKREIENLFGNIKDVQDLDYVCGWYYKAAKLIQNTNIQCAFVSTNSISQGSQVPILWDILFNTFNIKIHFAYQTFKWNSESNSKAAVHCVIIGFNYENKNSLSDKPVPTPPKKIYLNDQQVIEVKNISPYLFEGEDSFVVAQKSALCAVPKMCFGNQPRDGGHFILSTEEKNELVRKDPSLEKYIHPYIGAEEFINKKERWCFWLKNISPAELKKSKILYERVEAVKNFRLASKAKTTNGYAKVPHLFAQITQPDNTNYLIIPRVSSERRKYIPIGFMSPTSLASDSVQIIPNATLFHFGVLTSNVHMAWMRAVCGRLKSDYRYSKEIVYNTFPWPAPTEAQKAKIEETAQGILDARSQYPDSSLADLYDETVMPASLRKAHQENDKAVMIAYGFDWKNMSESECVAELFKMYEKLT